MIRATWARTRWRSVITGRRRSSARWRRRSVSSTFSSSSWNGSGSAGAEHLELAGRDLDLAGVQARVDGLERARDDLADDAHHGLHAQVVRRRRAPPGRRGVDHDLHQAGAVAQVDEDRGRRGRGGARPSPESVTASPTRPARSSPQPAVRYVTARSFPRAPARGHRAAPPPARRSSCPGWPPRPGSTRPRRRPPSAAPRCGRPGGTAPWCRAPRGRPRRQARRARASSSCASSRGRAGGCRIAKKTSARASSASAASPAPAAGARGRRRSRRRGRRPADRLGQPVVAPAAADRRLRAELRPLELPRRARVVVEAAHQRRLHAEGTPRASAAPARPRSARARRATGGR